MNFDVKDVKSWHNRHDVKVGDKGYFGDSLADFNKACAYKGSISKIDDYYSMPFTSSKEDYIWGFFLPLGAVKEDKIKYDIKDVKTWANRHDVKTLSVTGFFGNSLSEIDNEIRRYNKGEKDRLHELYKISDNGCFCFGYAVYFADTGAFAGTNNCGFFLPLDAVKEE